MLLFSGKSFMCTKIPHHYFLKNKAKRLTKSSSTTTTTFSKKQETSDFSDNKENPISKLKISSKIVAQSAIAILGLGFIDAGYSGDWSRIGVISKETEDVLKIAAFLVVPLCLFVITSIIARNSEN